MIVNPAATHIGVLLVSTHHDALRPLNIRVGVASRRNLEL